LHQRQRVVDQSYSIREAADVMNVGKLSMDKWLRQLRLEREGESGGGSSITSDQLRIKELEKSLERVEEEKEA
jgi:transposase